MPISDAVTVLDRDLRAIFGDRLRSLVAYGASEPPELWRARTVAVVTALTVGDLQACAGRIASWHDAGLATPLVLDAVEFGRSLDAFPFEFGAILSDHVLISGSDPFEGLRVDPADIRRACEIQTRSHLLHLREAYIEAGGRADAVADLVARSSNPLAALLRNVARLAPTWKQEDVLARVAALGSGGVSSDAARELFPEYLLAVERLVHDIDRWGGK